MAILATLNLVIDFDFVEQGADLSIPRYIEVVLCIWFNANNNLAIPVSIESAD